MNWISSKLFCSAKAPVKRAKRKVEDWDKVLVNHTSDKGPLFRIYKELSKLKSKVNNPMRKWAWL